MLRALIDGLILRCPRCHQGRMFQRRFTMHRHCPQCGLEFERASGEVTGGMGINIVLTLFVIIVGAVVGGSNTAVPLAPLIGGLALCALLLPIVLYRSSRGVWAAILYLTRDNAEGDHASRA